jgi:hypothetical protein
VAASPLAPPRICPRGALGVAALAEILDLVAHRFDALVDLGQRSPVDGVTSEGASSSTDSRRGLASNGTSSSASAWMAWRSSSGVRSTNVAGHSWMLVEPVDGCWGRGAYRGRVEPGGRDPERGPVDRCERCWRHLFVVRNGPVLATLFEDGPRSRSLRLR